MGHSNGNAEEPTKRKHGCIVMASGAGTRFGGNKLMADLCGEPLIACTIRATDNLFGERVAVTRHADVARLCDAMGIPAILHDKPLRNDAVLLGMEALRGCDAVMFVQGDQPLIDPRTIAALLRAVADEPGFIWRASFGGVAGTPVVFPSWAFDELRSLPPAKGGGFVAKAHANRVRVVQAARAWEMFDVDTPANLQALRRHVAQSAQHIDGAR